MVDGTRPARYSAGMATIYRYALLFDDTATATVDDLPADAQVIRFGVQMGFPSIWAIVDPTKPPAPQTFKAVNSGDPFPDDATYIGTIQADAAVTHLVRL